MHRFEQLDERVFRFPKLATIDQTNVNQIYEEVKDLCWACHTAG
jgi:hypothetical protein